MVGKLEDHAARPQHIGAFLPKFRKSVGYIPVVVPNRYHLEWGTQTIMHRLLVPFKGLILRSSCPEVRRQTSAVIPFMRS